MAIESRVPGQILLVQGAIARKAPVLKLEGSGVVGMPKLFRLRDQQSSKIRPLQA